MRGRTDCRVTEGRVSHGEREIYSSSANDRRPSARPVMTSSHASKQRGEAGTATAVRSRHDTIHTVPPLHGHVHTSIKYVHVSSQHPTQAASVLSRHPSTQRLSRTFLHATTAMSADRYVTIGSEPSSRQPSQLHLPHLATNIK